jgi:ubiquinone/menaquinone biosynthesis C-methylase UbiE
LVIAQSVAKIVTVSTIRYDAVDVHSLPYADSSFDLVIGSECLHHLDNPVVALKELRRVIRPTGAYLGVGEGFASPPMLRLVETLGIRRAFGGLEAQQYAMKEALYTFGRWRAMFRQAGFSGIQLRLARDPSLQYQNRTRLLYYTLVSLVPSFVVKSLLGCSLEIWARP